MAKEFVERILKKLFGDRQEPDSEEMAPIKEKLIRSEKFEYQMRDWSLGERGKDVLHSLNSEYQIALSSEGNNLVHLHRSPQANGFFFDKRIGAHAIEFKYLLDHFKKVVINEGYTLYTSDKKYQEKAQSVQVVERHYMKPSLSKDIKLPIDQKYGNVLVEFVAYNDEPAYLKVMATCYSDRNYTEALDFEMLARKLFSVTN
ncbi:MAG: hypothetical protein MK086_09105 [Flavobacteriales bacterium]|nr:hypothetical protein [Flavobacteriales bacterium]